MGHKACFQEALPCWCACPSRSPSRFPRLCRRQQPSKAGEMSWFGSAEVWRRRCAQLGGTPYPSRGTGTGWVGAAPGVPTLTVPCPALSLCVPWPVWCDLSLFCLPAAPPHCLAEPGCWYDGVGHQQGHQLTCCATHTHGGRAGGPAVASTIPCWQLWHQCRGTV